MFTRLLVVLLVETPNQLFEDRAHPVVVEAGIPHGTIGVHDRVGTQIDVRRSEFLDERAQGIRLGQPRNLVAEFEVVENVLDVGRKAVEVGFKVSRELLTVGA